MTVFGTSRGSFTVVNLNTSKGQGVQLTIGGSGSPVGNSSLVTSFSVNQAENYAVSQCLNGGVFLYTFGHDPQRSTFGVGVTTFLNNCNGEVGADLAKALSVYRAGRVSASKQLSSLSVGTGSFSGYLIGQGVEVVDSQIGIISTTYNFIALKAQ